jgi:hypothetical protein
LLRRIREHPAKVSPAWTGGFESAEVSCREGRKAATTRFRQFIVASLTITQSDTNRLIAVNNSQNFADGHPSSNGQLEMQGGFSLETPAPSFQQHRKGFPLRPSTSLRERDFARLSAVFSTDENGYAVAPTKRRQALRRCSR